MMIFLINDVFASRMLLRFLLTRKKMNDAHVFVLFDSQALPKNHFEALIASRQIRNGIGNLSSI